MRRNYDFGRSVLGICATAAILTACGGSQPPIGAPESGSDAFANLAPRYRLTLPVPAVSMLLLVGGCGNRSSASHASVSKSNNEASSFERDLSWSS